MQDKRAIALKCILLFGATTLVGVFSIHWLSIENFRKNIFPIKNNYFEIKLINRCLVHEKYFWVEVFGKQETFDFQNNKSRVLAQESNKVRLAIDKKYSSYLQKQSYRQIKDELVLIAECRFDTSIQNAIRSIRKQFAVE